MLLLSSNGLSSPSLLARTGQLCAGAARACIVTTASVGYKERDKHVPRLTGELESLGLAVELYDFDEQDPSMLRSYDVVELNGGNPFYLRQAIARAGGADVLAWLAQERLLIGVSAGAIVLQRTMALIAQYSPELNDEVGLADWSGLGLTSLEVLAHYERFLGRFGHFEEQAKAYETAHGCCVLRLNDGQGVLVGPDGWEAI